MQLSEAIVFYQNNLLQALQNKKCSSLEVLNAFLKVRRDDFISAFFERVQTSEKKMIWTRVTSEMIGEERWLDKIYQDVPLVTSLDARKFPDSSSSQPSIMAAMLDALKLTPAHRVLEIGTGTGFNTALIASLTGNPQEVTTVEVNGDLANHAELAIEHCVGPGMTVVVGNGLQGYVRNAPYDRIIATGSSSSVPLEWIDQLAPGGLMLMNFKRSLANVMIRVEKHENGKIVGEILPISASFMPLHDGTGAFQNPELPLGPIKPVLHTFHDQSMQLEEIQNRDFFFFLLCHLPGIHLYKISQGNRFFVYLADHESRHLLQFHDNSVRGSKLLWQQLQSLQNTWHEYGDPSRMDYSFEIQQKQQLFKLEEHSWVVA